MPTDAQIPLMVKSPEIQSPVDSFGKLLTLRHMIDSSKLNQAHLEAYGLENEARRRSMGADKAMADLLSQNMKPGPDGTPTPDYDAAIAGLVKQGYGNKAVELGDKIRAQRTAQLANEKAQDDIAKQKGTQISQALQGVEAGTPDPSDPSLTPAQRAASLATREARHQVVKQDLIQRKLITDPSKFPAHYADDPTFYPTQIGNWTTTEQVYQKRNSDREFAQKLDEFKYKKAENVPKDLQEWGKTFGQYVGAAKNKDQYAAGLQAMKDKGAPQELLSRFSPEFSTDMTDLANSLGMTSQERSTEAHRGEQERHAQANEELRSRQLDQQNKRIEALISTGQQNADTRRDLADWRMSGGAAGNGKPLTSGQYSKLLRDERAMSTERRLLGTALYKGEGYVDRLGNITDTTPNDTQREGMVQRYLELTKDLGEAYEVKNRHILAGGGTVKVSTEQAQAALDAGARKLHADMLAKNPKQGGLGFSDAEAAAPDAVSNGTAAPATKVAPAVPAAAPPVAPVRAAPPAAAPKAAPPQPGKVATMADVQRFATAHKMNLDEAKKAATAQGWQIQ